MQIVVQTGAEQSYLLFIVRNLHGSTGTRNLHV